MFSLLWEPTAKSRPWKCVLFPPKCLVLLVMTFRSFVHLEFFVFCFLISGVCECVNVCRCAHPCGSMWWGPEAEMVTASPVPSPLYFARWGFTESVSPLSYFGLPGAPRVYHTPHWYYRLVPPQLTSMWSSCLCRNHPPRCELTFADGVRWPIQFYLSACKYLTISNTWKTLFPQCTALESICLKCLWEREHC